MIKHFISLEWKQYIRSSYWQKNIFLNILLVIFGIFILLSFLGLGFGLYPLLKEIYPEADPFIIVNGFIFYWVIADLLLRFFLQKLPVMTVKPLLVLPISKFRIVNYVLGKSATSFFNFLPLFAIVPFTLVLSFEGYNSNLLIVWGLTLFIIVLINNFLNFIIESLSAKTELSFLPILASSAILYGLNFFEIINFSELLSIGVLFITDHPLFILIPIILLALVYTVNYKILRKGLFIDVSLNKSTKEVSTSSLEWTRIFGDVAPFVQLDLKLLWRNKRPRSAVFILVIGLLYGLFFYPQPIYREMPIFFVFIGIFVTGIFLMNFGQFIPAWDSGYYKMLMSQNIKYEEYLKSKYTLMALSVIIMFVLSIPYVYFGWEILVAHFAAAVYNLGINTYVILFAGSYNRKKINLDQRAAFNYQGTGAVQWLIGLPLMGLPVLIFWPMYKLVSFEVGIITLIALGVLGIALHQKILKETTKKYLASKYKMIDAFSQEN